MIRIFSLICMLALPLIGAEKAVDFSLRDLDGTMVRLADIKGKGPILIDFWATWCKPCVKSLPHLQDLHTRYKEKGLYVWAINEDGTRSLSKVAPFAASLGLTMPVLLDENQDVLRAYRASGLPTTLLIDRQGIIVLRLNGYRPGDEKKLEEKINELLEPE